MDRLWNELYNEAAHKLNAQEISPFIEYGNNACAILASNDKIYSGVSITSSTLLDCSAEESAIREMLNDNERYIKRILVLNELEEVIRPLEESLEYLLELCDNPKKVEVLIAIEPIKIVKLIDIIPDWWGTFRLKKN